MQVNILGAILEIDRFWKLFHLKNKPLTKEQVIRVLNYGKNKGFIYVHEIPENDIDMILYSYKRSKERPQMPSLF